MPEVFANTTPLQYLHRLARLEWLRDFHGRIVVPETEHSGGRAVFPPSSHRFRLMCPNVAANADG